MKKKYIRPESRLFLINLSESIATSAGAGGSEMGGSSDFVQMGITIRFHQITDGCRGVYTNDATAPVRVQPGAAFINYLTDYYQYYYCADPSHAHRVFQNGCVQ